MELGVLTFVKLIVGAAVIGALLLFAMQQQRTTTPAASFDGIARAMLATAGVSESDLRCAFGAGGGGGAGLFGGGIRVVENRHASEARRLSARAAAIGHSVAEECAAAEMDDDAIETRCIVGVESATSPPLNNRRRHANDDDSDDDTPMPQSGVRVERSADASFERECQTLFEDLVTRHGGSKENVKHSVVIQGPSLPPRGILVSSLYVDSRIMFGVCPLPHHLCEFPNSRHTMRSAFDADRRERAALVNAALADGVVIADVPFSLHGGCSTARPNRRADLERFISAVLAARLRRANQHRDEDDGDIL